MVAFSQSFLPGDSGSPVIALRDGKPELVGLVNAQVAEIFTTMIPVDVVVNRIKELTGINIRQWAEER